MRLSVLFLSCFCLLTASFDFPISGMITAFIEEFSFENDTETKLIRNPAAPFRHEGTVYYWKGYYQAAPSYPQRCIFNADRPEWPFGNVTFENGSSPTGVEFGCRFETWCNKTHCSQAMSPSFFWGILLLLSGILAIAVYFRYWIARRGHTRIEQDIELRSVYVPVVVPGRERQASSGGPPYRAL